MKENMNQKMRFNLMIDGCRHVKGAITIANAMDLLEPGRVVYVMLSTTERVSIIKSEVAFVQYHESNGEQDVKITLEFRKAELESGINKKHISVIILGEMLNGRSPYVGDEEKGNLNRLFVLEQDALDYYESVRYIRQVHTLSRVTEDNPDVNSIITRLLKNKPSSEPPSK